MTMTMVEKLEQEGFEQICVWEGVFVVEDGADAQAKIAEFESWMKDTFGCRAKYLGEVRVGDGRNDLFFAVHKDDVMSFAIPRLEYGIRWYEDVVKYNDHADDYPAEIIEKYKVRW